MIGSLNALGPIVTMPFLLTYMYAAIDYSYFKLAMAMSYDIRQQQKFAERKPQDLKKSDETRLISSENKGNGKKMSYGSGTFEKHDFGEFNQQDAMEKDDSQEKENVNKDDSFSVNSSPLGQNTGETKVDVQAEDASVERGDGDDDTTKLLEKKSNKERNRQEETKDKSYYEAEAYEERKRKNF